MVNVQPQASGSAHGGVDAASQGAASRHYPSMLRLDARGAVILGRPPPSIDT
jgi:hypothetical protein